ncbi:OmpW/AlkL family protein [Novosphingobium sp. M1R2S20]|uniref:OmpW family protein n=1 Tax=Novosphingobium rhizovicinum TaxID=3228928 RepID=A0ABV3RBI8_9SPHN
MRKTTMIALLATATALTAPPALAGSRDGKLQVKVLGTAVLPDGEIDKVKSIDPALGSTLTGMGVTDVDAKANDNVVPTLALEYFFSKTISVETICCLTQHHVNGAADLAGTRLVNHVLILPATVTFKAHLDNGGPIKPYVGAGPSVFFVFDEKPGATAAALGVDRVKMSNALGVALQAGVDIALGQNGYGLSLDAKKYFIEPTASFYADGAKVLETRHNLNPWVLSAGVSYRF